MTVTRPLAERLVFEPFGRSVFNNVAECVHPETKAPLGFRAMEKPKTGESNALWMHYPVKVRNRIEKAKLLAALKAECEATKTQILRHLEDHGIKLHPDGGLGLSKIGVEMKDMVHQGEPYHLVKVTVDPHSIDRLDAHEKAVVARGVGPAVTDLHDRISRAIRLYNQLGETETFTPATPPSHGSARDATKQGSP